MTKNKTYQWADELKRVNGQLTRDGVSIKTPWRRQRETTPLYLPRIIMAMHSLKITENGVNGVRAYETDSSLGKEDHVLQVAPERHPATVRNKDKIIIGTWNVSTLNHCGKLENVKQEMQRLEINILGVSKLDGRIVGISKASTIELYTQEEINAKEELG